MKNVLISVAQAFLELRNNRWKNKYILFWRWLKMTKIKIREAKHFSKLADSVLAEYETYVKIEGILLTVETVDWIKK